MFKHSLTAPMTLAGLMCLTIGVANAQPANNAPPPPQLMVRNRRLRGMEPAAGPARRDRTSSAAISAVVQWAIQE